MLKVRYSSKFKKDYKNIIKRGYKEEEFRIVLDLLRSEKKLPEKYQEHFLKGNYKGYKECHISPDWLLIYKIEMDILTLTLTRTRMHSDLF